MALRKHRWAASGVAILMLQSALVGAIGAWPAEVRAQTGERRFSIPAGGLNEALVAFAEQSDMQVGYLPSAARDKSVKGLAGTFTPETALRRLLAGTGLTYTLRGNAVSLSSGMDPIQTGQIAGGTALDPVVVDGGADGYFGPVTRFVAENALSATKTGVPIAKTPQTVSVVTREQIDNQGVRSISEALRYTSGVLTGTAGTQTRFDSVYVRGFGGFASASNFSDYLDGMRLLWPGRIAPQIESWGVERVEVLHGPASVLYGQSSPGGLVNAYSKRPRFEEFESVELGAGSHDHFQSAFDVGGVLDAEDTWAYRLVGHGRKAGAQTDFYEDQRIYLAPSITYQPTDATRFTLLGSYTKDPAASDMATWPAFGTVIPNPAVDIQREWFDGNANYNNFRREQANIGYEFEHEFSDALKLSHKLRYQNTKASIRQVTPYGYLPGSDHILDLGSIGFDFDYWGVSSDTNLQIEFDTGVLTHHALIGIDTQHLDNIRHHGRGGWTELDLLNRDYFQDFPNPVLDTRLHQRTSQLGLYAQDHVEWGDFSFLGGIRHDYARTREHYNYLYDGTSEYTDQSDRKTTWRGGVVYSGPYGLSPFASYATSFEPAIGADFNGNLFEPTTGQQYEIGLRFQPPGTDLNFTVSAFDLTKQNVSTPDPLHDFFNIQTGEIRSRGLEFEAKASLDSNWNLVANYAYWDTEVTRDTNAVKVGKRPVAVPEHTASLWIDYGFDSGGLEGFGLGSGVRYVGPSYGDDANTIKVPGFALVDISARYDFGAKNPDLKGLQWSLNITNLFDKTYIAACADPDSCYFGQGRSIYTSLKYSW